MYVGTLRYLPAKVPLAGFGRGSLFIAHTWVLRTLPPRRADMAEVLGHGCLFYMTGAPFLHSSDFAHKHMLFLAYSGMKIWLTCWRKLGNWEYSCSITKNLVLNFRSFIEGKKQYLYCWWMINCSGWLWYFRSCVNTGRIALTNSIGGVAEFYVVGVVL